MKIAEMGEIDWKLKSENIFDIYMPLADIFNINLNYLKSKSKKIGRKKLHKYC